jgi:hypothetical protein
MPLPPARRNGDGEPGLALWFARNLRLQCVLPPSHTLADKRIVIMIIY